MKGGAKKRVMTSAEEEPEVTVQNSSAPNPMLCGEKACKGVAQGEERQRSGRWGEGGASSGKQCLAASPEYHPVG